MSDKKRQVLEEYKLDVDMSFEEFDKKYPDCYKTTTFGSAYPRVALDINDDDSLWIDFEHDESKIRHIELSDKFGRRYEVYQRHFFWWLGH